ncbi:hypothetical protein FACS1894132_12770 [Clostridia bacterium]|nr:hypothetical protein FACS1894132_12770 [Clostridia bacterium]
MSINNILNNLSNVNSTQSAGKAAYAKIPQSAPQVVLREKSAPVDEIRISGKAIADKEIADEKKKITAELTADRSEYLNAVKEQYNSGAYNVSSTDIANSILSRFI